MCMKGTISRHQISVDDKSVCRSKDGGRSSGGCDVTISCARNAESVR